MVRTRYKDYRIIFFNRKNKGYTRAQNNQDARIRAKIEYPDGKIESIKEIKA